MRFSVPALFLPALLVSGCAVYRFSSPDYPTKVVLPSVAWQTAEKNGNGMSGVTRDHDRFYVAKVRGGVGGGGVGKTTITPDELNRTLALHWPDLFAEGDNGAVRVIPLTVNLGGELPFYGNLSVSGGDLAVDVSLLLMLGVMRMENKGHVTASILVENGVWAEKARADGKCNEAICCQPLLFLVAYPLLHAIPPYESDWPSDNHFGSIAYVNADRQQQIATDLAAVAVARAVTGLSPEQMATLCEKVPLTGEQVSARKRLAEGAQTKAAFGGDVFGEDTAVIWTESSHEFKEDGSLRARGIPDVLEQRYDIRTRKGFVRADVSGCDPEEAYRYLTGRLIPAICETKNIVLDVDEPPPSGVLFRTLKEERESGSDILAIEFEALQ